MSTVLCTTCGEFPAMVTIQLSVCVDCAGIAAQVARADTRTTAEKIESVWTRRGRPTINAAVRAMAFALIAEAYAQNATSEDDIDTALETDPNAWSEDLPQVGDEPRRRRLIYSEAIDATPTIEAGAVCGHLGCSNDHCSMMPPACDHPFNEQCDAAGEHVDQCQACGGTLAGIAEQLVVRGQTGLGNHWFCDAGDCPSCFKPNQRHRPIGMPPVDLLCPAQPTRQDDLHNPWLTGLPAGQDQLETRPFECSTCAQPEVAEWMAEDPHRPALVASWHRSAHPMDLNEWEVEVNLLTPQGQKLQFAPST